MRINSEYGNMDNQSLKIHDKFQRNKGEECMIICQSKKAGASAVVNLVCADTPYEGGGILYRSTLE